MKRILLAVAGMFLFLSLSASEPTRGYRGFAEWENGVMWHNNIFLQNKAYWHTGVSTSHGYQFNPHLYLGGGIMMTRGVKDYLWTVPLFADIRTDHNWNGFTPWGDLRIGYNLASGGGLYLAPTIGYRLSVGRKVGLNLGLGMIVRGYQAEMFDLSYVDMGILGTYPVWVYTGREHHTNCLLSLKFGVDF